MEEVIALEKEIREALAKKKWPAGPLVDDAKAIMAGKPTKVVGTRLERLKLIAASFRLPAK